jgi:uncharacterized protein
MMTSNALLIGAGLLILAGSIMVARRIVSWRLLAVTLLIALVSSGASAGVSRARHSGTGVVVSRGYPKPYHFYWRDFEGRGSHRGMNAIYFAANTFVHLGAIGIVAALVPRRRDEEGQSLKMPGKMVVIRVTLGIVFVILGIIGGFVPIMQGWIFMLLAFLMLFPRTRMAEKILTKAAPKLPRTVRFLRKLGVGNEPQPQSDTMRAE